ncbi:Urease accessory protein [Cenarchaeum symbiosum A]|uniref:Urease accessory protein n=1 Tax=Cenarchaeum symbiosum (strain A) TaxID=414004 RepID=A0RUS0_CENSY|nr:Urease accessory protein [Cenarchaeum symbiosum A]
MLEVREPLGNVFDGGRYAKAMDEAHEVLRLSRQELEKRIIRRSTDGGTDVGISLAGGARLRHGDVLHGDGPVIIIEQKPEKVMVVTPGDTDFGAAVLLGHVIGNRHRPVSVKGGDVCFPIQADSEAEVFGRLLGGVGSIDVKIEERIFVPDGSADVHGH